MRSIKDLSQNGKKVNSFKISDKLINKMKDKIRESIDLEKEIGFVLCQKKNKDIIDRNQCIGTDCKLESLQYKCPKNEKLVGDFHTHPGESSAATLADLSNAYGFELGSCIAGTDAEINCYTKKGEYNEIVHRKIYDAYVNIQKPLLIETTAERMAKVWEKSEEITNKYFKKTKIAEEIF